VTSLPDAYPLQWPEGWPRTRQPKDSRYAKNGKLTEAKIRTELLNAIRLLGGSLPIISSNVALRLDGLPYTNQRYPEDGGIAVYWVRDGKQEVMACDRWKRPWENMRAVYHAIEGLRAMERAGATQILERAFQAFRLPEGGPSGRSWRDVLGHDLTDAHSASVRFRKKAVKLHPDVGGDVEDFQELERAYREALDELR